MTPNFLVLTSRGNLCFIHEQNRDRFRWCKHEHNCMCREYKDITTTIIIKEYNDFFITATKVAKIDVGPEKI